MSNQKNSQWFTTKILYPEERVKDPERVGGGGGGGGVGAIDGWGTKVKSF